MKCKFIQISLTTFKVQLKPETFEEVEFLLHFEDDNEAQAKLVNDYYLQAIEKKFEKTAFIAFMQQNPDYPKSIICIIKESTLVTKNKNINLN